jgi:ATP-dependent helicase/DNAse subunit B
LNNVLKLSISEDGATELDAKLFGTFMHSVLQRFGEQELMKSCSDVKEIEKFINISLDEVEKEKLGINNSAKISIQLELARYRLKEFAKHQAQSVREGWKILCTERFLTKELKINGSTFTIRGTIDRVETNASGEIRVLDYKTGSITANKAHLTSKKWIDLQLPLYRLLLTSIPELEGFDLSEENVSLGYFKIGDQESSSGIDLLEPKPELNDLLEGFIESTIAAIIENKFSDTPVVPAPKFNEQFSWLCQDNSVIEELVGYTDE